MEKKPLTKPLPATGNKESRKLSVDKQQYPYIDLVHLNIVFIYNTVVMSIFFQSRRVHYVLSALHHVLN